MEELATAEARSKVEKFLATETSIVSKPVDAFSAKQTDGESYTYISNRVMRCMSYDYALFKCISYMYICCLFHCLFVCLFVCCFQLPASATWPALSVAPRTSLPPSHPRSLSAPAQLLGPPRLPVPVARRGKRGRGRGPNCPVSGSPPSLLRPSPPRSRNP